MMIDITEHMGLAYHMTWKVYPRVKNKYEFEDLFQIACVGLIKAGKGFDEARGIKFTTYAVPKIKGEIIRFITDDKKFNISRSVPHNFMLCSYEAERENGSLESRIGTESFEDDFINIETLNEAIQRLSNGEKKILKLHIIEDLTQKQVGEMCGIAQNQVSRIKRKIIENLKGSINFSVCEKVTM